jgi:hypothetical protein
MMLMCLWLFGKIVKQKTHMMSFMHHFTSGRRDNKLLTEKVLQEETVTEQIAKVEVTNVEKESETKLCLYLLNEKKKEKMKDAK